MLVNRVSWLRAKPRQRDRLQSCAHAARFTSTGRTRAVYSFRSRGKRAFFFLVRAREVGAGGGGRRTDANSVLNLPLTSPVQSTFTFSAMHPTLVTPRARYGALGSLRAVKLPKRHREHIFSPECPYALSACDALRASLTSHRSASSVTRHRTHIWTARRTRSTVERRFTLNAPSTPATSSQIEN